MNTRGFVTFMICTAIYILLLAWAGKMKVEWALEDIHHQEEK